MKNFIYERLKEFVINMFLGKLIEIPEILVDRLNKLDADEATNDELTESLSMESKIIVFIWIKLDNLGVNIQEFIEESMYEQLENFAIAFILSTLTGMPGFLASYGIRYARKRAIDDECDPFYRQMKDQGISFPDICAVQWLKNGQF